MMHPAVELALSMTKARLKKIGLASPAWFGASVMGPRKAPGPQQRMPTVYPLESGKTYQGLHLTGGDWVGLSHTVAQGPLESSWVVDSIFDHHLYWISQLYEVKTETGWTNVLAIDVELEHADYARLIAGDLSKPCRSWTQCAILGIGGQAVQTVQRGWEVSSYEAMGEGGPLFHLGGIIRDVGRNRLWGRASFAISHHKREWNRLNEEGETEGFQAPLEEPYQNDILLRQQVVDLSRQATCRGVLLADGRRRRVRLEECIVLCSQLEQPMAKLVAIDQLELVGCILHAEGGQAWLQVDKAGTLATEGCVGNVNVHRDGQDDGPVAKTR